MDTTFCARTFQFKKSYFVKIFRKKIEQILSEVPQHRKLPRFLLEPSVHVATFSGGELPGC